MNVEKYLTKYLIAAPCGKGHMLCISTLTGALDLIPNDTFARLSANGIGRMTSVDMESEIQVALAERGYLLESANEEKKLFQSFRSRTLELVNEQPFSFWICPTFGCNLECTYCFEGDSRREFEVMTKEMIDAAFLAMNTLNTRMEKPTLNIYGGEPLMAQTLEAVSSILTRAERVCTVNIITNGTQIPQAISMLKSHSDAIHRIQVTLDGVENVHDRVRKYSSGKGSFNQAANGIDVMLEAGLNVQIRTNLDRNGYEHFPEFVSFVKSKGWTNNPLASFYFTMTNDRHCAGLSGCMDEVETAAAIINIRENMPDADKFKDIDSVHLLDSTMVNIGYVRSREIGPKFHFCNANYDRVFVFGVDGKVYPCPSATGYEELAIGEFFPVLQIDRFKQSLWSYPSVDTVERCKDCTAALLCGGDCAFKHALAKEGQFCEDPVITFTRFAKECQNSILRKAGIDE